MTTIQVINGIEYEIEDLSYNDIPKGPVPEPYTSLLDSLQTN